MSETLTETPRPALAVTREPFGQMPDGTPIWRYRMTNRCRMTVELVTYGARIHAIHVPDMHGNSEDITLGFDSLDGYLSENDAYFGATIGRYANRIGGARVDGGAPSERGVAAGVGAAAQWQREWAGGAGRALVWRLVGGGVG